MVKIKYGNVVLCEYVGQGSQNKPILINVYSGDIVVSKLPADLSIGLFFELAAGQSIKTIRLEMRLDARLAVAAEMVVVNSQGGSALVIPQFPLKVEKDSVFEIKAFSDGYAPTVLATKRIFEGAVQGYATAPIA